jgi:hypothetical protein
MKYLFLYVSLSIYLSLNANDINLKSALQNIKNTSNKLKLLKQNINLLDIKRKQNNSIYDSTIYINSQFGQKDSYDKTINDSYSYLIFKKNLYNEKANILDDEFIVEQDLKSDIFQNEIQKEKINYMRAYFDIFITELFYQYQAERIVSIYSKKTKTDDAQNLGRASDIEIFKTTTNLLVAQDIMVSAKQNEWNTKSIFANMINIDENNLTHIQKPNIKFYWKKDKLDLEIIKSKMYQNNISLKILNKQLKILVNKIHNLSNNNNINISANAKIGNEPSITAQNNDIRWQGSLNISIPIYDNSKNTYELKKLHISKNKLIINIDILKQNLNKKLLKIVLNIKKNIRIKKALISKFDYADLNSEKSRALFEIDRKSDLGNSLSLETKVIYEFRKNEYDYVINNEKLNLLIGDNNEIYQ